MELETIIKNLNELNFTAIDIETANEQRNSICSIGYVTVKNGIIAEKKNTIVKPKEMRFTNVNKRIHGICEIDVLNSQEFDVVWEHLSSILCDQILLAHNADFDMDVLKQTLNAYGLNKPSNKFICTQKLAQEVFPDLKNYRLVDVAGYLGLNLIHHNSISDATIAAEIGIKGIPFFNKKLYSFNYDELTHCIVKKNSAEHKSNYLEGFDEKKIDSGLLKPNLVNVNPDNLFYNKKVVFTGDMQEISRQDAASKIQSLGADINTSISKKTQIVIVGNGAGPSKMKKIEELKSSGYNIRLVYEKEFISLIDG
jgi:DNA polymerase-3 subunit epsilon